MHCAVDVRKEPPCAAQRLLVRERLEEWDRILRKLDYLLRASLGIAEKPDCRELEPRPRLSRPIAGGCSGLDGVLEHPFSARERTAHMQRRAQIAEELEPERIALGEQRAGAGQEV